MDTPTVPWERQGRGGRGRGRVGPAALGWGWGWGWGGWRAPACFARRGARPCFARPAAVDGAAPRRRPARPRAARPRVAINGADVGPALPANVRRRPACRPPPARDSAPRPPRPPRAPPAAAPRTAAARPRSPP